MAWPLSPMTPPYNPSTSLFSGMSREALQQTLAAAQQALIELQMGKKVVSVSYAQGDGSRSVSYTAANLQGLSALIMQLQRQLGIPGARRAALRCVF